jgi:hypothetical protein
VRGFQPKPTDPSGHPRPQWAFSPPDPLLPNPAPQSSGYGFALMFKYSGGSYNFKQYLSQPVATTRFSKLVAISGNGTVVAACDNTRLFVFTFSAGAHNSLAYTTQ